MELRQTLDGVDEVEMLDYLANLAEEVYEILPLVRLKWISSLMKEHSQDRQAGPRPYRISQPSDYESMHRELKVLLRQRSPQLIYVIFLEGFYDQPVDVFKHISTRDKGAGLGGFQFTTGYLPDHLHGCQLLVEQFSLDGEFIDSTVCKYSVRDSDNRMAFIISQWPKAPQVNINFEGVDIPIK